MQRHSKSPIKIQQFRILEYTVLILTINCKSSQNPTLFQNKANHKVICRKDDWIKWETKRDERKRSEEIQPRGTS